MKVKEIYENALALSLNRIDEEDGLEFFAVKMFNILMSEIKQYNNQLRIKKGKPNSEADIVIEKIEDNVDCEPELYAALSYGLAAKLLVAQEYVNLGQMYYNQYVTLVNMASPAVELEVE